MKFKYLDTISVNENKTNEEWSTDTPVGTDWSFLPEEVVQSLIPNFLTKRPPVGMLTVEDSKEIDEVRNAQKNLTMNDYKYIKECNDSPPDVFYSWLTRRGQKVNMSELKEMWNHEGNIQIIKKLKECYERKRPFESFTDVRLAPGTYVSDKSFPSGHSTGAFYIASKLGQKFPHLQEGLYALAHDIANTRIQAGAHYPSDVAAGKAIGIALAQK